MKKLILLLMIIALLIPTTAKAQDWYVSQLNTGAYSSINCGPACAVMALEWAGINKTVEDARDEIKLDGGCWTTDDVEKYIKDNGAKTAEMMFPVDEDYTKNELKDDIFILCVDMGALAGQANGIGHFIVVKDYTYIDKELYLVVNDPLAGEVTYSYNTLVAAAEARWPYAIEVSEKE